MQPLALVFYEKLLPGSQLVNRLQDLQYRVQSVHDPGQLLAAVRRDMPMLLLADLAARADIAPLIAALKVDAATSHIPVIAFAALAVSESALASYLPQLLNQALHIE